MNVSGEKATLVIRILISLVLSFLAIVSGLKDIGFIGVPDTWLRDFLILLSISSVSSLGLAAVKRTSVILLLLSVRGVTVLLMGLPFGEQLSTEFILITALISDITFSLKMKPAIAFLSGVLPLCLISQMDLNVYYSQAGVPSEISFFAYGLWAVVYSIFGLYIGSLRSRLDLISNESDHRKSVIEELIGANRGYLEYATAVELETSEKERKRIITELHDVVGQSFTNILAITDMAEKQPPDTEELEDLFSVIRSQARYGLDETRAVLYKLHTFQPIVATGLRELNRLITVFTKSTHLKVDVNWANLPWDLGQEYNSTVFNIIRESLVNSFRHGKATRISIHFRVESGELFVDIVDNGRGTKSIKKGIGLSSMEERVAGLKGEIHFQSRENEFSVHVRLPLPEHS